jgi:hypothetical protein
MNPLMNLVFAVFFGNRISYLRESDNGTKEEACVDVLDPVDPEKSAQPASSPPPRAIKKGLLSNPYVGLIETVRYADVPAGTPGGGKYRLYEIVTGAASFNTFDYATAILAYHACMDGEEVRIDWGFYRDGRKPSYDIRRLSVLLPHGNSQSRVQDQ